MSVISTTGRPTLPVTRGSGSSSTSLLARLGGALLLLPLIVAGGSDTPTGQNLPGPGEGAGTITFAENAWEFDVGLCIVEGDSNAPTGYIYYLEGHYPPEEALIVMRRKLLPGGGNVGDPGHDPEHLSDLVHIFFGDEEAPDSIYQGGYQPEIGHETMIEPFLNVQGRSVSAVGVRLIPEGIVDPARAWEVDLEAYC